MYEKPDVTRYGGTELLDLMGPVETQYAQTTCEIMGTDSGRGTQTDPIRYRVDPEFNPELPGLFELSIPVARIEDRCEEVGDNREILVNFIRSGGGECNQVEFPYAEENGLLVFDGDVEQIMIENPNCSDLDDPFSLEIEIIDLDGPDEGCMTACEGDGLRVWVEDLGDPD
jgi:hypothetical protein